MPTPTLEVSEEEEVRDRVTTSCDYVCRDTEGMESKANLNQCFLCVWIAIRGWGRWSRSGMPSILNLKYLEQLEALRVFLCSSLPS